MKKRYLLWCLCALLFTTHYAHAQLTVTATAVNPTICLGNSTVISASATPVSYTVSAITNNPIPSPETNFLVQSGTAVVPQSYGINMDDAIWDNISLPFAFRYYGNVYNAIQVSTNGWIAMAGSNTASGGYGVTIPNAAAPNNVIHAISADLDFRGAANPATIDYFVDGTAPNRKFVVCYTSIKFLSPATGTADVQVILYEGTNVIEIHTSDCTNTSVGKTQGIENSAGTVASVATGRNNTTTWSGFTNAYRFTPDVINFTWTPATGLNTTTGANVVASPTSTTTYTVNAVNASNGQTGSKNVTITINSGSYTLAATAGGPQICQNINVQPGGSYYRDGNCNLIGSITPAGASPVSNSVNVCVKLATGSTKRGTADLYGPRQYDMDPIVNPATATANITLYYLQSEFDNFNSKALDSGHKLLPTGPADATGISNLMIRQFHGTGTDPNNYPGSTVDFTTATSGCTVTWNATRSWWEVVVPVTGFSGFFLTSKKTGTLAVSLAYFKGAQSGKKHLLNWKVNCTSAEVKFVIERSGDGLHYNSIGNITATQARCDQPFDFTDDNPLSGINYYRIRMVDMDGKASISNIVTLVLKDRRFTLAGLYPNLISGNNPVLKVDASENGQLSVSITDFSGRLMSRQQVNVLPGMNQFTLDCSKLSAGAYLVTVAAASEQPQTLRLVKQ
jgi:hypothetical protein